MALGTSKAGEKMRVQQVLQSNDPLTQLTEQYREIAGRNLDQVQFSALLFLLYNGSPGLARDILTGKQYQADSSQFLDMTRQVSVNEAARDQMEKTVEAQARASR